MSTRKNREPSTPPPSTPSTPPAPLATVEPPRMNLPATNDHAAKLDAMALAMQVGDLAGATAAAGGQDEDLPPSHDFDADPVAVGVILGLTLAEVEDEARPGVLEYPMIMGLRTYQTGTMEPTISAVWLGAHLEATMKRICAMDRSMPDRRTRGLQWRDHVAEAGCAWEGVPVVLYNYGRGPAEKGRTPARLFRVKTFLELRGLSGDNLARFCDLWRAAVRPTGPATQSATAADRDL